jgi:hypothetical protein
MKNGIHAKFIVLAWLLLFGLTGCNGGGGGTPSTTPVNLSLTSISPTSGPIAGGTLITVTGTGFQTGATVELGNSPCIAPTIVSNTEITCTTTSSTTGTVNLTVTNSAGTTSTLSSAYLFIDPSAPTPAPTLVSISPTTGYTTGFTTITLTGTNFVAGLNIQVGNVDCGSIVINSASTATCQPPSQTAAATVSVSVTDTGGTASLPAAYTYVVAPTYTQLKTNIFSPICSTCHNPGGEGSGFVELLVYSSISNVLVPGNPSGSTLIQAVEGTIQGVPQMPEGETPLTTNQIQQISQWIASGAPNN